MTEPETQGAVERQDKPVGWYSKLSDDDLIRALRQGSDDIHPYCAGDADTLDEFDVALPAFLNEAANRLAALAHPPSGEPIPMVLHCPECGLQHIDAPEWAFGSDKVFAADEKPWTNPPHRSHLCAGCGHIWRPADVATVGVHSIQTSGKADSPSRVDGTRYAPPSGVGREAVPEASARPEGGGISIPARPANPQHVRADGWWSEDGLAWYHPAPHAAQAAAPTVHVVSSTTSSPQPASVPAEGEADVAALVRRARTLLTPTPEPNDAD